MSDSSASDAGLAGRYAKALFDLANEQGSLDQVADDLRAMAGFLRESPELKRTLPSPMVPTALKINTLGALGKQAGFADLTIRFLSVVATQTRLTVLEPIIDTFLEQVAAFKGEISAQVISAAPLADAQVEAVRDVVGGATGKSVRLETVVDPSLLAGMIVRVGSRMVDASLKTKLRNLELAMRGAG